MLPTGSNQEARVARWADFMRPDGPPGCLYLIQYDLDPPDRPHPWPSKAAGRVEWAWRKYEARLERMEWLADDSLAYLDMLTGTEIFAEALGCAVYRPEDEMPAARPLVTTPAEADRVRVPELSGSTLAYLFDMADELFARTGGEALVRLPDIQSPMDIAALVWEKSSFYRAMAEAPEAVEALAWKVHELLTAFLDEWFARYGQPYVAHHPDYYMADGMTLSEDEIGVVSPADFERFFLPHLTALSSRYGGMGIHCCAHARHQWAGLKRVPELRLLNLEAPGNAQVEAYEFFGPEVVHMHANTETGPPETWVGQHAEGIRLILRVPARDREEALRLAETLWEQTGR